MRNSSPTTIFVTVVLIVAAIAAIGRLNFWIWRKEHPGAPTWTFFAHGGRS